MNKASTFLTNVKDLPASVKEYKNIIFQLYALNAENEKKISDILLMILEQINKVELKNLILTILRELIINGLRANYKRIHFLKEDLDINKEGDYAKGIRNFKENLTKNPADFVQASIQNKLFVQVSLAYKDEAIIISVINNAVISPSELTRVKNQVKEAETLNDLSEAVEKLMDFSEGAGLGIPMIILMLKNAGGTPKAFNIAANQELTKVQVSVPKYGERITIGEEWTKKILDQVQHIPSFPENVGFLQKMINDENASIQSISTEVKKDPSLVADLLRVANSAGYATLKRVESIDEALKNIGLKGLNGLLVAAATQSILEKKFKKVYMEVWTHSLKTAYYADRLCFFMGQKEIRELAYITALLHDLGKMVLLTLSPKTMGTLDTHIKKEINEINTVEKISFGLSHSEVGALITEHWNFPKSLVEAIRLHHQPLLATEENIGLVYMTYLANMLLDIERGYGDFVNIEQHVLDYFKLDEDKIREMANRIGQEYQRAG